MREKEWASRWDPQILYSDASLVEEHLVLKTPAHHGHGESDYAWTVLKYLPDQTFIEYTVFTPDRLRWIAVRADFYFWRSSRRPCDHR